MNNTKNKWEPLLYSGLGVAAMFLILVAVGVIAGAGLPVLFSYKLSAQPSLMTT